MVLVLCLTPCKKYGVVAQTYTIGFYNVENLFDTVDDPLIDDSDFLPTGKNQWTKEKYFIKLQNISAVLKEINADIMGLAEVENRKVLEDLVAHPNVASKRYQIIHFDMDDGRGIDVALLYRSSVFKPITIVRLPIRDENDKNFKTRDILWVKGIFSSDTLHVVVNHWPSRSGGGKEDKRMLSSSILKKAVDSVCRINPSSKIIITGDFNDDPTNKSIKKLIGINNGKNKSLLTNISEPSFLSGKGSLYYNESWNLFDQVIISKSLLNNSISYLPESFSIYFNADMKVMKGKNAGAPRRSFRSNQFDKKGYSDHFPVLIKIKK